MPRVAVSRTRTVESVAVALAALVSLHACGSVIDDEAAENSGKGGAAGAGASGGSAGSSGGSAGAAGTGGTTGGAGGSGASGGSGGATRLDAGTIVTGDPVGWAAVDADGQNGTSGGRDGEAVEVTTLEDFRRYAADATPRIVRIAGTITIPDRVEIGSNKTIVGAPGAVLHGGLDIANQKNVILQDLTLKGNDCFGAPTCGSDDAMQIYASHHVWLDHLDISDGSDGNVDIRDGSNYITISWTKFWYSRADREHRFSNLIGADDDVPADQGKLKVTFHHDWWADNVNQRMPRTRAGDIHVFNNLFSSNGNSYCTNAGKGATLLVENNVYRNVNTPHEVVEGNLLARGNLYENVTGRQEDTGIAFTPPYPYTADATAGLADAVIAGAGPR
jgi:pectate lyase